MFPRALTVFVLLGLLAPVTAVSQQKQTTPSANPQKPATPAADAQKPATPPADAQKKSGPPQAQKQPAAPTEVQWVADKRGCKFANPTPKPNETVTWSGACADGLMQGKGVLQFTSDGKPGARYEGTLSKGRLTGRGALRTPDGSIYDGDWVDGKQDGYGEYTGADGSKYQGAWTAGQPDGSGTYRSPKGEVIHGVWENGKLVRGTKQ
jgi:hypothetical protein